MNVSEAARSCGWRGHYVKNVERVMSGKPPIVDAGGTMWNGKCYMKARKCPVCGRDFNGSPRQRTCSHYCARRGNRKIEDIRGV